MAPILSGKFEFMPMKSQGNIREFGNEYSQHNAFVEKKDRYLLGYSLSGSYEVCKCFIGKKTR